jgi:16S rRNA (uracil1498-N3)-methyltransferase
LCFVESLSGDGLALGPDDRHHLTRVLRVRPGDEVTASDGRGAWRSCTLGDHDSLVPSGEVVVEPSVPVRTVAVAVLKGDRNELVVQKLTELGIDRIVFFTAARSVTRWDETRAAKQAARFARVAREAAMQCRRVRLAEVVVGASVADVAALGVVGVAEPGGARPSLELEALAVGPEGGFEPDELASFSTHVVLGPHILRAETAAIAAGTLLSALRAGVVTQRD